MSIGRYKSIVPWSNFGTIVEIEAERLFISFADAKVKALCVANWDKNSDGELDGAEAAAVTDIGTVFWHNAGITSFNELKYFSGLTSIGEEAFDWCTQLTTITIPNSVTSIGYKAFHYCNNLTSVNIPNSVTSIGSNAFYRCYALTSVTIPNSVTSIGISAFDGCSGLTSVTIPNSVTSIGYSAFNGCSGLTSVTIPNSVTSIGEYAFCRCSGLTSVNIPNSVTSIGSNAFSGCSSLTSVTIPNSVTSIEDRVFSGCSGLTSVTIPNSVTSIGNYAFMDCKALTSINIPNSVTSIGEQAFIFCSGLTSVTMGNSVTSIGNSAFSGCSSLRKVIVPDIAAWCGIAFDNYLANPLYYADHLYSDETSEIKNLIIPNSVTSIGSFAFYNCSGLTSVTVPDSVTSIGRDAFDGTGWYNKLPNGMIYIGSVAYKYKGVMSETQITITDGIVSIGTDAFRQCTNLASVSIPNSVTSIGSYAFQSCFGLITVTIGNSVKSIENYAFAYCSKLTDVYCYAESVPSTGSEAFTGSNIQNARLHVPYGCKAAYEAVSPWNEFGEIVEMPISITIGETGFATFCSSCALDFSDVTDIKAYIVSGFNQETGTLVLTRVTEVPAGEGLYIAGTPGEHRIPKTQTSMFYANLLKGVTEPTIISPTDGNYTNYILSNGSYGIGFYTLSQTGTLDAGKAYLQLPTASVAGIKALKIEFDENDDPTGIAITSNTSAEENSIYNLAGQRVSKAQKGINIVNGKKVFIK